MSTPPLNGPPPPLPSVDELLALTYQSSAFERGQTSNDYRRQHRDYGEPVRHWKGYENAKSAKGPNGEVAGKGERLHIEQPLPDDVRALFSRSSRALNSTEFGVLPSGTATISVLPDEIELSRGDLILRVKRSVRYRCGLRPSGEMIDRLPHRFINSIGAVLSQAGPLSPDEFRVAQCDEFGGIQWTGETPPQSSLLIEYRAFLLYEYQGLTDNIPPEGTDGKLLPQIGALRLVAAGEKLLEL